jgi:hypothetical protein
VFEIVWLALYEKHASCKLKGRKIYRKHSLVYSS